MQTPNQSSDAPQSLRHAVPSAQSKTSNESLDSVERQVWVMSRVSYIRNVSLHDARQGNARGIRESEFSTCIATLLNIAFVVLKSHQEISKYVQSPPSDSKAQSLQSLLTNHAHLLGRKRTFVKCHAMRRSAVWLAKGDYRDAAWCERMRFVRMKLVLSSELRVMHK